MKGRLDKTAQRRVLVKGEYSTAGRQTQTPSLRNVKMKLTNNHYGRFHRDDN